MPALPRDTSEWPRFHVDHDQVAASATAACLHSTSLSILCFAYKRSAASKNEETANNPSLTASGCGSRVRERVSSATLGSGRLGTVRFP